ncbi:Sorting nexin-24 [Trichoplax sp. H2]|nr:Sorting nexin-24 [Trichoplax sp. H2]|eukprot:RDD45179.1 Sorting nexin-24 [Trichoplax sp. H2]
MIEIDIRNAREVHTGFSAYTAYAIEIVEGTALQIIEKRYSEFLDLHKSLKDVCRNLPKFPKRTLMKNNPKVVETRRKLLEIYLQDIVSRGDRKINAVLHEFLGIGSKSRSNSDNNYILSGIINNTQPIMRFSSDARESFGPTNKDQGDIVIGGVLGAIYSDHN